MTEPPAEHAIAEIKVEGDRTAATLVLPVGVDRDTLNVETVTTLARDQGVEVTSEVAASIERAITEFHANPRDQEKIIATATPAQHGEDGWLEWEESYAPTIGCVPVYAVDNPGRVDHYNCLSYIHVPKDAQVATIHEPTRGEDGCDVKGGPIRAKPGKICDTRVDPSLVVRKGGRVIARLDGLLEFKGNVIRVANVFEVSGSVDFSTGNIDFEGSVTVKEGVCDRFVVKATENIIVHGLIQAATLECAGDLIGQQGMAGRERGTIKIGGDADVGYLDSVSGTVEGDLVVQRELVHCQLEIGGDLRAPDAVIIGGAISLKGDAPVVQVGRIGTDRGIPTILALPALADDGTVQISKRVCPGAIVQLGSCVVEFDRGINGPLTLGWNGKDEPYYQVAGGASSSLATVARVVRTAA